MRKQERTPRLLGFIAFLNTYVIRWLWMRVSWQPVNHRRIDMEGEIHRWETPKPGSFKFHFPVHPNWLFKKKEA